MSVEDTAATTEEVVASIKEIDRNVELLNQFVAETSEAMARTGRAPGRVSKARRGRTMKTGTRIGLILPVNSKARGGCPWRQAASLVRLLLHPGVQARPLVATSHEPFKAAEHDAYNGLCLVIVRAKPGQSGRIRLRAESDGLTGAEVTITSAPAR